jgi:ABC-type transporter MlaC component
MEDSKHIISIFEKQIQKFIERKRPSVEIRDKVDLSYSFDQQTLDIFEIRPRYDDSKTKIHSPIARAKFVKARNTWKIYWMRASGKWELYDIEREVETLADFFKIVEEDSYGCFWG